MLAACLPPRSPQPASFFLLLALPELVPQGSPPLLLPLRLRLRLLLCCESREMRLMRRPRIAIEPLPHAAPEGQGEERLAYKPKPSPQRIQAFPGPAQNGLMKSTDSTAVLAAPRTCAATNVNATVRVVGGAKPAKQLRQQTPKPQQRRSCPRHVESCVLCPATCRLLVFTARLGPRALPRAPGQQARRPGLKISRSRSSWPAACLAGQLRRAARHARVQVASRTTARPGQPKGEFLSGSSVPHLKNETLQQTTTQCKPGAPICCSQVLA